MTTASLRGELRWEEPMARYTSWRVGGPAQRFFAPADVDELAAFLAALPHDEPLCWVGLGSNLLVRDGGLRGAVVHTPRALSSLAAVGEAEVHAGAGVACAKVARFCSRRGLADAEFLAGIPGTVGGALAMNAGAWGGETWRHVVAVETLDRRGERHRRDPDEYRVGYRCVTGPGAEWFVAATLRFRPGGDPEALLANVKRLLSRRGATQPTGRPSCGSVFRNPPGEHAARLIESAGLKGVRLGGAYVSEKHANFIINDGGASAADIEGLIRRVQARVAAVHGIELATEVRIVGEEAAHD